MNNEEMNEKMEFIVEHQAKFAAEIEIAREVQAADAKLLKEQDRRLADAHIDLVDIVGGLTRAQVRTDEGINRLSEAQARTEESLKALISTVERYIGGNGGSHSHA